MTGNRQLPNIFVWFVMTMVAACGGGSGGPANDSNDSGSNSPGDNNGSGVVITVPGAPVIGSATAGNAQATVMFTAPASNGGAAITGYTVTSSPGGRTASGSASPLTVTGLTNGVGYTFTVTATNSAGAGQASSPSNSVTPSGTPVVNVTATSPKLLTFSWPALPGTTHYKLLKNPDGVSGYAQLGTDLPGTATTATDYISVHLHNWINASYIVQACNTAGCSNSSAVFTSSAMIAAIGYIKASNTGAFDWFGSSVSLSADGTTLAVGAILEYSSTTGINSTPDEAAMEAGAVYVFRRNGTIWNQQAYIKASNTGVEDWFGVSLSLSADGTILAVGANREDSSTSGINSTPDKAAIDAGAVYIYTRNGNTWTQQAYIKASNTGAGDLFGGYVSLSADGAMLAVGAPREDSGTSGINSTPDEAATDAGAVYVYTRNGNIWSEQAYIKASNSGADDLYCVLSLSADGTTLVVGAPKEDSYTTGINSTPNDGSTNTGAAYVYTRSGSTWSQQAYIKASNIEMEDYFALSISLSADGNILAVGVPFEDSATTGINSTPNGAASRAGAVYVYSRSGSTWSQQAYIKASSTGIDDMFGLSLSLSADGATLAVGADREDSSTTGINTIPNEVATDSGAVYIYSRSGSIWSQRAFLKAPNTEYADSFGHAVSLSGDGMTLAVGADQEDSGTTGINSTPDETAFDAGAVYLY